MKNKITSKEPSKKDGTHSEEIYFFKISDLLSSNLNKSLQFFIDTER